MDGEQTSNPRETRSMFRFHAVVAMNMNSVIGNSVFRSDGTKDFDCPWYIPAHTRRLERLTKGKIVLSDESTFWEYKDHIRPSEHIIISGSEWTEMRLAEYKNVNVYPTTYNFLYNTIERHNEGYPLDVYVLGGYDVFWEFEHDFKTIYMTLIQAEVNGNTFFPRINLKEWALGGVELERAEILAEDLNVLWGSGKPCYPYKMYVWNRIESASK